jgi:allantoinase
MDLLIRNAHVVTRDREFDADIHCRDGLIDAIRDPGGGRDGGWDDVYDADGRVVFPGVIDPHVHSRDPGQTHKEDFAHATRAAAAGGVTTLLDMPNAIPPVTNPEVFHDRVRHHSGSAFVDFGLWGLILDASSVKHVQPLKAAGAVGLKLFWGFFFDRETGALVYDARGRDPDSLLPPASMADLWELFDATASGDILVGLHSEDRGILEAKARRHSEFDDYETLLEARPVAAESAAIAAGIEVAMGTGARLHILHISSRRGASLVRTARADGLPVSAETCPHYLTLTADDFRSIGPMMKVYPPVRTEEDRDALWEAVNDDAVTSVSSDHAPHSAEERRGTLSELPAGSYGVQTMVQVLLNEAAEGRTTLRRLSWVLSEGTARLYGLYPQKGSVEVGTDADFTVVDPDAPWAIDQDRLLTKMKLSPWHGRKGRGLAVATILRGGVVMRDGEPVGDRRGRFIHPAWHRGA